MSRPASPPDTFDRRSTSTLPGGTLDKSEDEARSLALEVRPFLFLTLECARPLAGGARWDLTGIDELLIGRGSARDAVVVDEGGKRVLRISVPDRLMSSRHARIERAGKRWSFRDLESRNGSRVEGALSSECTLPERALLEIGGSFFSFHAALPTPDGCGGDRCSDAVRARAGRETLLPGHTAALHNLVNVARSTLPILVLGESGTGKELISRAVHEASGRSGPFVALNCGALAPNLIEGQLFGHARGAFSGALRDEPGLVRASHGGTLFLDEIGELPLGAQATLLRVLQEHEVLPIGATKPVSVDLRVVAATHQRIDQLPPNVFRHDLYARLAGFTMRLPPLRARREDMGVFVGALLAELAPDRAQTLSLTPSAARALLAHSWPLNLRELNQALRVALLLNQGDAIDLAHLPEPLREPRVSLPPVPAARPSSLPAQPLRTAGSEELLKQSLIEQLTQTAGNVSEVARVMGRTRMQIHRWMKRFAIDPESFR
jgi:DNA-binding NtrC family response regulator